MVIKISADLRSLAAMFGLNLMGRQIMGITDLNKE